MKGVGGGTLDDWDISLIDYILISNTFEMKMGKKPLSGVMAKKELQGRLEKCYICSKFLPSASQLMAHIEEHQNKINRTTVEEIQRKTQESFKTKRQPSALIRTNSKVQEVKPKEPIGGSSKQKPLPKKQEEDEVEQSEQSYEEALRQSQILLEKIDFLTQVPQQSKEKEVFAAVEDQKQEELTIDGDYQLYMQLKTCSSDAEAQTLIIRTLFEDHSFENYQEQLKHLKNLMKIAVNPESINKIASITRNITKDVIAELKNKYDSLVSLQGKTKDQKQTLTASNNNGEIQYCSICYGTIEAGTEFMESQFGSAYHKECLEE